MDFPNICPFVGFFMHSMGHNFHTVKGFKTWSADVYWRRGVLSPEVPVSFWNVMVIHIQILSISYLTYLRPGTMKLISSHFSKEKSFAGPELVTLTSLWNLWLNILLNSAQIISHAL
jgi:hypothetical protein